MYSSVEIKKEDNKYKLFIDGKFIKEEYNIIKLIKKIKEYE